MFILKLYSRLFSFFGFKRIDEECGFEDSSINSVLSIVSSVITVIVFVGWLSYGAKVANRKDKCDISSVADFAITLPYALGCSLFKERFKIKLN